MRGATAPVAQMAEATDSKSVQCGFDSHRGYKCGRKVTTMRSVKDGVESRVLDRLWDQVWYQAEDEVWDPIEYQVWYQVQNEVWDQVQDPVQTGVADRA